MNAALAMLLRELRLAARSPADAALPVVFYVMLCLLFPLGAAPNAAGLSLLAPALLWTGALLAALLTLERSFRGDHDDGTLEQVFLAAAPAPWLVLGKMLGVWIVAGLPLVLLSPLLATLLGLAPTAAATLVGSLLLGTPALFLVGGFLSALVVGLPRAGALLPILVLPMASPILIFGAGSVRAAVSGVPAVAPLYFLAAILLLCLCLLPLAIAAALRNAIQ